MTSDKLLEERKKLAADIINKLYCYDQVIAVLINGSLAWGAKGTLSKNSDIDLDIILRKKLPDIFNSIREFRLFRDSYNKLIDQNCIDYGSWKYKENNIMAGLHFLPMKSFTKVCSLNYKILNETICFREYRISPKDKPAIYIQNNFAGKQHRFECKKDYIDEGIITYTPVAIIDHEEYYNGLLPDKYLSYPIIYSKDDRVYSCIYNLKKKLNARLKWEKERAKVKDMNLGNLLHAKGRIPSCEVEHLNLESNIIDLIDEDLLHS